MNFDEIKKLPRWIIFGALIVTITATTLLILFYSGIEPVASIGEGKTWLICFIITVGFATFSGLHLGSLDRKNLETDETEATLSKKEKLTAIFIGFSAPLAASIVAGYITYQDSTDFGDFVQRFGDQFHSVNLVVVTISIVAIPLFILLNWYLQQKSKGK